MWRQGWPDSAVCQTDATRAGRLLLLPLLALGAGSVLYWHWTEMSGRGDLRFYILVQFLPILLTPYILLFFRSQFSENFWLWCLVGFYSLAKLLELTDHFWFDVTDAVSGHTLKHLSAAAATYCMYLALRERHVRPYELRRRMMSNS